MYSYSPKGQSQWALLAALLGVDALLAILFESFAVFFVGAICEIIILWVAKRAGFKNIYAILGAYILGCVVIVVLFYGYKAAYQAPYYLGTSDDYQSEFYARSFVDKGILSYSQITDTLVNSYNRTVGNGFVFLLTWFVYVVEWVAPYHTVAFRIMNLHFLLLSAILISASTEKERQGQAKRIFLAIALFPSLTYIACHVFRDTLCALLFAYILYDMRRLTIWVLPRAVPVILIMYLLRPEYVVLAVGTYAYLFYRAQKPGRKRAVFLIASVLVIVIVFERLNMMDILSSKITSYSHGYLTNGDGFGSRIFAVSLFPFGLILRLGYGLFSPLPHLALLSDGHIESILGCYRAVGTWAFVFHLPYLFIGVAKKEKLSILSLIYLVVICATTFTFRHFAIFYQFALAASIKCQWSESSLRKRRFAQLSAFLLMLYLVAYFLLVG